MLVDRCAMITGASSGIGAATARALATAGARLVLTARRADRLEHLAGELGTDVHVAELDVRDPAAIEAVVTDLPTGFADIDVLVNNAGLASGVEPLHEGDPERWDTMIDTNVRGLLRVTRAVVPGMVERGRGHVINIGSIAGRETYPGGAVYCATKVAVERISDGLRIDLQGTGVKVTQIDPGMVETEFSVVRFDGDQSRADDVYHGMTPLTGDDIAECIRWVADSPPHVAVANMLVMPTDQTGAQRVHRR